MLRPENRSRACGVVMLALALVELEPRDLGGLKVLKSFRWRDTM